MTDLKVAYIGTGANGAGIAADIARAGYDMTLIEQWPAHVEAMRDKGITVNYPDGTSETTEVSVHHLCEVAELRTRFDLVFVGVKAYDTRWAVELIKPLLAEDGVVVGLQNGMTRADIASIVGPERSLGAVIEVTANMFVPGEVNRQTHRDASWFALEDSTMVDEARTRRAAEVLGSSGRVDLIEDIHSAKWMKLVVNAAELVPSAILGLPLAKAAEDPALLSYMLAVGREAVHAAVADGSRLIPILGMEDTGPVNDPDVFADALFGQVLQAFCLPDTETTSLQDWHKGRRNEVHDVNGYVSRVLQEHGMSAPLNDLTISLAEQIERGELAYDMSNWPVIKGALAGATPPAPA